MSPLLLIPSRLALSFSFFVILIFLIRVLLYTCRLFFASSNLSSSYGYHLVSKDSKDSSDFCCLIPKDNCLSRSSGIQR